MNFVKALKIKEKNKHLIGKKNKGATIEELILVPTNIELADKFYRLYVQTLNPEEAITPFNGVDVDVVAIFDKWRIDSQGFLAHENILHLPAELGVETE